MRLALVAAALTLGPWPLATIPSVGSVSWSCDHGRYALAFRAFRDSATDEVAVDGVKHVVQPGQVLRIPPSRALRRRLVFVQGIEPGTLRATVDIDFRPRPVSPSHCFSYFPPGVVVHVWPR